MEDQKKLTMIGFVAKNHRVIKAVELTPDLLSKRMIQLSGESGNGKSTLIQMLNTAIGGTSGIDKKDTLDKGYFSEAKILDGDVEVYIGAKVTEFVRGENEGEPKFETYIYAKDANGKHYTPIIDGVSATAKTYQKMLTTPLTFSMKEFFSENQTTHRKLIENLFKEELEAMKIDEVMARIKAAQEQRDNSRQRVQANGAFMEQFKNEGFQEEGLKMMAKKDVSEIEAERITLIQEKAKKESQPEADWKLKCAEIDKSRTARIQGIKDDGATARENVRLDAERKDAAYDVEKQKYDESVLKIKEWKELHASVAKSMVAFYGEDSGSKELAMAPVNLRLNGIIHDLTLKAPVREPYDSKLQEVLNAKLLEYNTENAKPPTYPEQGVVNVSEIEAKLKSIDTQKETAVAHNLVVYRFSLWEDWIEKKGLYEKEIDALRRMYAAINTGVEGMSIVPLTLDSGRVEVWMQYNGSYDKEFFMNETLEMRHIFEYSSFQRSAIGVMLQAARLNLKKKALRLAIVDDVSFTKNGLAVLTGLCEDLDVQLITSKTDDPEISDLGDSEILIQGGEIFFN